MSSIALAAPSTPRRRRVPAGRVAATVFMMVMTLVWFVPLLFSLYVSLRPQSDTSQHGYVSWPRQGLTFSNYVQAWTQGQIGHYFLNSLVITVPAVILCLALASMVAFLLSRTQFRGRVALLILFTAGNLLPQQSIITPLYRLYLQLPLPSWLSASQLMYNSLVGLVVINVAFQLGFCVFVLSNFMTAIPLEMYEAAQVDGAGLWTQFWRLTVPLCRPALGALGTLLTTWIYNDFFWATILVSTGSQRPITSAMNNLQGQFVSDQNMIAAAALIAAIPTLIVYLLLQRQFVAGLTLGSAKG